MYQVEERKFNLQVTRQSNKRENIPNDDERANKSALRLSTQRLDPNGSGKLSARLDHPLHRRRKAANTLSLSVSSCLNQFVSQRSQRSSLSQAGDCEFINRFTNHPRTDERLEQLGSRRASGDCQFAIRESSRECTRRAQSVDHRSLDGHGQITSRDQGISQNVEINVQNVNRVRDFNRRHPFKLTGTAANGEMRRSSERVAGSSNIRRSQHIETAERTARKGSCEIKKATKATETSETTTKISKTTRPCEEDSKNVEDGPPRTVQDVNLLYNSGQQHNSYLIKFLCKSSAPINCARNSTLMRLLLFAFFFVTINAAPRVVKIGL